MSFLTKILGDSNKRFLKKLEPVVSSINKLEEKNEKPFRRRLEKRDCGIKKQD